MNKTALPTTPTGKFEPVLKKDLPIGGGQVQLAGTVFVPTGKRMDKSVIEHYCYMRPVEDVRVVQES